MRLLPLALASDPPHDCLVRVDAERFTVDWLDSARTHRGIREERTAVLGSLRDALAREDERWGRVKCREWKGWGAPSKGAIPQQGNDWDCPLFVYRFAGALAAGAQGMAPVEEDVELRGAAMEVLLQFALTRAR